MENSNLLRTFLKYISLNVMGMIGLSCYILADTFFVSKGLGANGLAALNLAIPVYSFIHGSGLMIGMGAGTKYSILKSQQKNESADHIFTSAFILTLAMAAVYLLLGIFASAQITRMLGADEAVFEMSKTYLQVIMLFAPMFMLNDLLLCFVRNDGAPQLSMAGMIGGSLSNIVLDYVFIFPCGMGIFGAVLATGLAPVISMMILSPFFIKKKNTFRFRKCRMSGRRFAGILSSGLPSLITEVASGIVMIVFNMIILKLEGNVGVAAYGVIANLSLVVTSIYTGIAQGIQPLMSTSFGAGNRRQIHAFLRYGLCAVLIVSVLVYGTLFAGADSVAAIFNSENNGMLQQIAVAGLKIYFVGCLFAGFNIVISIYFTSTEFPLPAHIISLGRGFIVIIPAAFALGAAAGMTGVWCAYPVAELIVSLIGAGLFAASQKRIRNNFGNISDTNGIGGEL